MKGRILGLLIIVAFMLNAGCGNGSSGNKGNDRNNSGQKEKTSQTANTKSTDQTASAAGNDTGQTQTKSGGQAEVKKVKNNDPNVVAGNNTEKRSTSTMDTTPKSNGNDSVNFILQGYVEGGANSEVILDKLGIGMDITPVATTVVNEGNRFKFGGKIPGPGLYQLRFPTQGVHIILNGGVQRITTDIDHLGDYKMEGSGARDTRFLQDMYAIMDKYNSMDDSLRRVLEHTEKSGKRMKIYDKINKLNKKKERLQFRDLKNLVQRAWDAESVAAPIIAVRAKINKDLDYFKRLHNAYKKLYPDNYFVKKLKEKINNVEDYWEKHGKQSQ